MFSLHAYDSTFCLPLQYNCNGVQHRCNTCVILTPHVGAWLSSSPGCVHLHCYSLHTFFFAFLTADACGSARIISSFHGNCRGPSVAVHRNLGLSPLSLEDARVRSRLFAQTHRLAIVPVDLFWHRVFPRASEPAVTKERIWTADLRMRQMSRNSE